MYSRYMLTVAAMLWGFFGAPNFTSANPWDRSVVLYGVTVAPTGQKAEAQYCSAPEDRYFTDAIWAGNIERDVRDVCRAACGECPTRGATIVLGARSGAETFVEFTCVCG